MKDKLGGIPVVLALLVVTASARASNPNPAVTGATAGAIAGSRAAPVGVSATPPTPPGRELEDWKDPRTGSSARLDQGCDVLAELRLSTNGAANFLWLKLANAGPQTLVVQSDTLEARVDEGPMRRLSPHQSVSHLSLPRGWLAWLILRFPDKQQFAGAESLTVRIPVEREDGSECTLETRMERSPLVPEDRASSVVHTRYGIWLGGGSGLLSSGGLRELGGAGFGFGFGFELFPALDHGFFFDVFAETYPAFDESMFLDQVERFGSNVRLTSVGPFAGYVFRQQPLSWFTASLALGIGPYIMELADKDETHLQKAYFASLARLNADAFFATMADGTRFAARVSGYTTALPDGRFGSLDVSGVSAGAFIAIVVAE